MYDLSLPLLYTTLIVRCIGARLLGAALPCCLELQVSATSFFQTNSRQAEVLYRLVAQAAGGVQCLAAWRPDCLPGGPTAWLVERVAQINYALAS